MTRREPRRKREGDIHLSKNALVWTRGHVRGLYGWGWWLSRENTEGVWVGWWGLGQGGLDGVGDFGHVLVVAGDGEGFADRAGGVEAGAGVGPVGGVEG